MKKPQSRSPISTQLRILSTDVEELERQNNNLARLVGEANDLLALVEKAFEAMRIDEALYEDDNPNSLLLHEIREYLYS